MSKNHENLLEIMEKDAMAEREKPIRSAEEQIARIKTDAETQAKNLKEERLKQTEKQLQLERAQRLGKMELELKNSLLKTKHNLIQQTLDAVEAELKGLRKKKNVYDSIFQEMVVQSVREFDGTVVVKVNSGDKERCERKLSELQKPCRIETSKDISGGLEMSSEDGRFTVRNNFESRLAKAKGAVIEAIAKTLFE
ncbi:MAG: V-type ATP synthase subunit E [Candidatus Brocadiales bacterium]